LERQKGKDGEHALRKRDELKILRRVVRSLTGGWVIAVRRGGGLGGGNGRYGWKGGGKGLIKKSEKGAIVFLKGSVVETSKKSLRIWKKTLESN